jgi:hypothetical protein
VTTALITRREPRAIARRLWPTHRLRRRKPVAIRLWIPLTALLVLLSPLLLLATTLAALHPGLRRLRAHRVLPALAVVLSSISGTLIEVEAPGASIRLRIF